MLFVGRFQKEYGMYGVVVLFWLGYNKNAPGMGWPGLPAQQVPLHFFLAALPALLPVDTVWCDRLG